MRSPAFLRPNPADYYLAVYILNSNARIAIASNIARSSGLTEEGAVGLTCIGLDGLH